MDTYLYLVLFAEFLKENTTPILIVLAAFIMFVGFFVGWLVGLLRNNQVLADMETALLKIDNENQELKDYDRFAKREIDRYGMALDFLVSEFVKLKLDGKLPEDDRSAYFYAHKHAEVKAWAFDQSRSEQEKNKERMQMWVIGEMQNSYWHENKLNIFGAQNCPTAKEINARLDDIKKQTGAL